MVQTGCAKTYVWLSGTGRNLVRTCKALTWLVHGTSTFLIKKIQNSWKLTSNYSQKDRSDSLHGPENPLRKHRQKRKTVTIYCLSSERDICSLLYFGCFSSKVANTPPLFPNIFFYFLWNVFNRGIVQEWSLKGERLRTIILLVSKCYFCRKFQFIRSRQRHFHPS